MKKVLSLLLLSSLTAFGQGTSIRSKDGFGTNTALYGPSIPVGAVSNYVWTATNALGYGRWKPQAASTGNGVNVEITGGLTGSTNIPDNLVTITGPSTNNLATTNYVNTATNKLDTDLRTAIAASATNTDGTTLGQVRGVVQTNSVRLVLDHIPQPYDVTNTIISAIGDSHTETVSFPWFNGMLALPQWLGIRASTNSAVGSTGLTDDGAGSNPNCGTNLLFSRQLPWAYSNMVAGGTWLVVIAHGTVDQLTTIANLGGIENYERVNSNIVYTLKYVHGRSNNWNVVVCHPTLVPVNQNMKVVGSFVNDNPRRHFNNWLVRKQMLPASSYGYNNTNLFDIVPDYARAFPNNTRTNFWYPDFIHLSLSNSVQAVTRLWDRTLRGELPRIPQPFRFEYDGGGHAFIEEETGEVYAYIWEKGSPTTRTNRGSGGEYGPGGPMNWRVSPLGTFDNQVSANVAIEATPGTTGNPAQILHGLTGQTAALLTIQPAGGASVFNAYDTGLLELAGNSTVNAGHYWIKSSGELLWRYNPIGRSNELVMLSDGAMAFRNATNSATMMGLGPTGRIYTPESISPFTGTIRSNYFLSTTVGTGWGGSYASDIVFIYGTNIPQTLASAVGINGKRLTFYNINPYENAQIWPVSSSEKINGRTNIVLWPWQAVTVQATNSSVSLAGWFIESSQPLSIEEQGDMLPLRDTNGLPGFIQLSGSTNSGTALLTVKGSPGSRTIGYSEILGISNAMVFFTNSASSGSVTNAIASVSSNGVMIIASGATNLNFVNGQVTNVNGNVSVAFSGTGSTEAVASSATITVATNGGVFTPSLATGVTNKLDTDLRTGLAQTNASYTTIVGAPWLNTNTVNATLTNLIMTGTGTKLPPLTELGFDSSTESGWLQIQSDRTLQRTFDGSSLTNLTSANLVGALPAIDGSALTGITASGIDPRFTSVSNSIIAGSNVFHAPTLSTSNLIGGITVSGGSLSVAVNQTNTAALRISGGYQINPVSNIWVNWNIPASRFVAFTNVSPSEVGTPSPGSQFVLTSTNNQLTNITMTLPFNAFSEQQNQTVGSVTLYAASEQAFRFTYDFTSDGSIYRVFEESGPNNTNLVNLSSDGDKGDITISSQGAVMVVDSGAIVVSEIGGGSEDKLVGRASSGTGNLENINLSADFDIVGGVLTWIGASSSGTGMRTNQFTTNVVGAAIVGAVTFSGSVTNSSDMKVSGTLFSGDILAAGSVTGDSFSGQGTGLTDLNASNLGSGTVPFARAGSLTNHTDVAITALATGHVLGWDEATDKWTNGPPSAASGGGSTTITQTNFVLNTTYTNGSQAVIVRGTIDVTVAAVNGSGRMELMVDQTGGITFATLSRAGIDTTVAVTLAGVDYREIAGDIKPGALYYFTNASFGAGNAAAIRAGTGQIITISSGTNGATGATGATGAGGTNTFYPETDPDLRIKLGGDSMFWQTYDGNGNRIGYMDNANLVIATGNVSVGATLTVTNQAGAANRMALFGTDGAITAGAPATATTQNLAVVAFNNNGAAVTNISGTNIKWPTNGSTDNALIDLAKGYVFTNHTANFTITGFLASSVDLSNTNVQWATYTYTNNSVGAKTITLPSSWLDLGSKGNPVYNTNIGTLSVIRYPSAFTNYVWVGR